MATLADVLAKRGHDVHYASYQIPKKKVEGITFHKIPLNMNKLRFLKALSYLKNVKEKAFKWLAMDKALDEADCDVYIQVNAGFPTGLVADYCSRKNKRLIFRSTCLWDSEGSYPKWSPFSKELYKFGLHHASLICTNSLDSAERFKKRGYSNVECVKDGFVIPNHSNNHGNLILWVGRNIWYKQPHLFIQLANKLPHLKFGMLGISKKDLSKTPSNLIVFGRVTPNKVSKYYPKGMMVVNTSVIEGFPNTLVEAGMYSLPYVSFLDPDNVIKNFAVGVSVSNLNEMVETVKWLSEHENLRQTFGVNAKKYVSQFHNINKTVQEWERIL